MFDWVSITGGVIIILSKLICFLIPNVVFIRDITTKEEIWCCE